MLPKKACCISKCIQLKVIITHPIGTIPSRLFLNALETLLKSENILQLFETFLSETKILVVKGLLGIIIKCNPKVCTIIIHNLAYNRNSYRPVSEKGIF